MTKFTQEEYNKAANGTLSHTEWNKAATNINDLIDAAGNAGGSDPHLVFDERSTSNPTGKSNLTLQTTAEDQYVDGSKTKGGKINIEPISDLQIKPGDDISLCSHHREDPTEVSMKVLDGNDNPVKLQLNAANIVLTTKDKNKTKTKDANGDDTSTALYDDPAVMNVTVNSAKNTRGYLKVRAQAIDLRCEDHGGISLQPKGEDSDHFKNKIKFEHGGGDGLEFGTFNPDHTSLYTTDYRFKKDGVIKLSTRTPIARATDGTDSKYDASDATTHYYYEKAKDQNDQIIDDFYDVIDDQDPTCTWEDIVKFIAWAKANKSGKDWAALWA